MRGCLGWFILLPIAGAFWLAITVARACGRKGGAWRLLGVLISLVICGVVIGFAYLLFGEEGSTVLWWIGVIAGGLIGLLGTWTALVTEKRLNKL